MSVVPMKIHCPSKNETRLERKTVRYLSAVRAEESSSSATPYYTDSEKDIVVETETMILRHPSKPNFYFMETQGSLFTLSNNDELDDEEYLLHSSVHSSNTIHRMQKKSIAMTDNARKPGINRSLRLKKVTSFQRAPILSYPPQLNRRDSCIEINETTSLLSKRDLSTHSSSLSLLSSEEGVRKTSSHYMFYVLIGFFFTATCLLVFCIQPLTNAQSPIVLRIDGQPKYFGLNLTLLASNNNIVDIVIRDVDLDILASAGLPDVTSDQPSDTKPSQELLGHVKRLVKPTYFHALQTYNASIEIQINEPPNTLGKLIYLMFPYTLHIKGSLLYYTLTSGIQYSIPICSIHRVEGPFNITSRSCLK